MIWRLAGTVSLGALAGSGPLVGLVLLSTIWGSLGILLLLAGIGAVVGLVLLWRGQSGGRPLGIIITLSVLLGVWLSVTTIVILGVLGSEAQWEITALEVVLGVVGAGLFGGVVGSIYEAYGRRAL